MHFLLLVLSIVSRALASLAAGLLAPPRCAACDAPLGRATALCPTCAGTVRRAPVAAARGPIEVVVAAALYGGAVEVAVRRLKYDKRPDLARPLGHLVRAALRDAGVRADVVVPVPLHPRRLAERGYNQAALLAAHVADELDAPHAARALARVRPTLQQARCDRDARLANVDGAFAARPGAVLSGLRVALVDDVITTGATLSACAGALRAAGAASVVAVVLARADPE